MPYHLPFKTRPQTFAEMNSQQAAAESLWNKQQGQYSGMPATGRLHTGAHNLAGPVYSYGYAPPMDAANGSYSSSIMSSYSYTSANNWGASAIPVLSCPVNGYGNNTTCSLPGASVATAQTTYRILTKPLLPKQDPLTSVKAATLLFQMQYTPSTMAVLALCNLQG